jgi:hypothetical protein
LPRARAGRWLAWSASYNADVNQDLFVVLA